MVAILKLVTNFALIVLLKVCLCDETVEVKIKQGVVLGKVEKTLFKSNYYYSFRGIPYAAAPVQELRFKPPTAHKGWDNILEALEEKPTCMQFSARMRNNEPFGISGSEDCLFIDIFTSKLQDNAPVVIFDYNDDFKTGFNGTKTYSPDPFLEEGIVVVTIRHRLGLFGYLTTEDDVILGNNGLRDYIFGLEWVKDNVKNFGGDPNKVTLMGSSGGGALVNILMYSEKAKGLFSGTIIQSGNALLTSMYYENSRSIAFELGEKLDIQTNESATLLEELQKIDAEALLNKVVLVISDAESKEQHIGVHPFTPVIEQNCYDAVLPFYPGNGTIVSDVPVIIGFNSREGLDYVSHFLFEPKLLSYKAQENMLQFPIRTRYRFDRESSIYKHATKEIVDFYLDSKVLDHNSVLEYAVYGGDVLQIYSLNNEARKLSNGLNSPVFFYMFDYKGQLNENSQYISRHSRFNTQHWGATVGDELCYLHVCCRIRRDYVQLAKMASEQTEQKVLRRMVRMWTNFAKTGNPTPTNDEILKGFSWEPVSKGSSDLNYLHINKKLQMNKNPMGEREKFWDNFIAKYAEIAVNGVVKGPELRDDL